MDFFLKLDFGRKTMTQTIDIFVHGNKTVTFPIDKVDREKAFIRCIDMSTAYSDSSDRYSVTFQEDTPLQEFADAIKVRNLSSKDLKLRSYVVEIEMK